MSAERYPTRTGTEFGHLPDSVKTGSRKTGRKTGRRKTGRRTRTGAGTGSQRRRRKTERRDGRTDRRTDGRIQLPPLCYLLINSKALHGDGMILLFRLGELLSSTVSGSILQWEEVHKHSPVRIRFLEGVSVV
eukprot:5380564-Prymnesium_polylepis.1